MKKYGDYHFMEDNDGYVHVYTDGSCENNGRSNAIAGYGVYFGEGHPLYVSIQIIYFRFFFIRREMYFCFQFTNHLSLWEWSSWASVVSRHFVVHYKSLKFWIWFDRWEELSKWSWQSCPIEMNPDLTTEIWSHPKIFGKFGQISFIEHSIVVLKSRSFWIELKDKSYTIEFTSILSWMKSNTRLNRIESGI